MRVALALLCLVVVGPAAASAARLPATVAPEHYDLAFTVDLAGTQFSGTEAIRVRVTQRTTEVVLHALDLQIRDVTITAGGSTQRARVSFDSANETATLSVARPIVEGAAEIRLRFSGVLNDKLRGFYLSRTPRRRYAFTQFESTDARRAFPCFDEPALKATFALSLTVDAGDTAISNGRLTSDTPGPGRSQHTLRFSTSPRMSSYLVAMAVGDFRCVEGAQDGVPLRVCAVPEKTELGRPALDAAAEILKYFHTYYTIKYPFAKLDLVAVPDFAASGMENTAAIFFRETDLLVDANSASTAARKNIAFIVAHEIAHQWFGDLVTMAWWDDLWLNEGFATWMATRPLDALHPEWHVAVEETAGSREALSLDSMRSTHAIRARVDTPAEIEASFDAIAYEKGAAILRMIEQFVGADAFRRGVNAYLQAHAYSNATAEDLWKAIASASGRPVDVIMPTFVDRPGVPLVEVALLCEDNRTVTRGDFSQVRFSTSEPALSNASGAWRIPLCVKVDGTDAARCYVLEEPRQTLDIGRGCPSWAFVNAGGRGYYRTAYSPAMLRGMAPSIQSSLSAPERLTLLDDEWALVQAGRHSIADFLTVASGFGGEPVSSVLRVMTSRLSYIAEYLTPGAAQAKLRTFAQSLFRPSLNALGSNAAPAETDDRHALRATLVGALGGFGGDADVIARSRADVTRALDGGPPLEPDLADTVLSIAAANGDAALFDRYVDARRRAKSPDEQHRYLYALPAFTNPALVERALQEVRSPEFRAQDTSRYLRQFFRNPAARARAWAFVKEHWKELEPRIKVAFNDVLLVNSLGAFCDASTAADIRSFFAAHPLPSAGRTLAETGERIEKCVELNRNESTRVRQWLDATVR